MTPEISLDLGRIGDRDLRAVGEKVASGKRLSHSDAELLFISPDLLGIGMLADYANRRKHGDVVTFAANQHINPTNVCYLRRTCVFCSFARLPKEEGAYHYTLDQVYAEAETAASGLTTGSLCARAAPRTMPITSEPAIPMAATLRVAFSPCQKSGRWSQMNCQSKLASRVTKRMERPRDAAAPSGGYGQIDVTSLPTGYAKLFFGRGTLSMKSGTYRAGAFARRIFANSSFFFR